MFDGSEIVSIIVGSATSYLIEFAPVILFVAGLVMAIGVMGALLDRFFPSRYPDDDVV